MEQFEHLYLNHHDKVYRLALGLTGNEADAEEIAQEAFLRAFRAYDNFRGECSFFTWIYRITLNVAKDYMKKRSKLPIQALTEDMGYTLEEVVDPNPDTNPETELLANETRYRCLHCMTECLPMNQRKVFCLAISLGLPHKLVAEILECSVGTVKTTLHRAKKRWSGYMENRCEYIKKSNPCRCSQWIRFSLSQGWLSAKNLEAPKPTICFNIDEKMLSLKNLRYIYQQMYRITDDKTLVQRLQSGLKNKEWAIFE